MKITELRPKSKTELNDLLKEKYDKLCQLRFNLVSGKVKNVKEVRETKKEIARILTLLKQI
ncbi:50S ribosomal protein L29 [Candidatus Parcubacteria bacterium]|nr:50S ribosomal protein L29 [Candidatus Parcubacteria bacterium]